MAIKIGPNTNVIDDGESSNFNTVNIGAYTKSQLDSNTVTGESVASFTFCTDCGGQGKIVHWNGSNWLTS